MKKIAILGSTGSIGQAVLDIVRLHPGEYSVAALSTNVNIELLARQVREFHVPYAAVFHPEQSKKFSQEYGAALTCFTGLDGLKAIARLEEADIVVNALVGAVGVLPTLAAITAGKRLALANKESLVMAGEIIMEAVRRQGIVMVPIDSEHSALHQCLRCGFPREVRRIILTASGGPFWQKELPEFKHIRRDKALAHPTWNMGSKITIDSATLMNKGLEVIEAYWLFGLPVERIQVVIHPQSIIHSLVEFIDSSLVCQMSRPDMRLPIQYALTYPERVDSSFGRLEVLNLEQLTFFPPDLKKFPCLQLAYDAIRIGRSMPCVLSAANEVAVDNFLKGRIEFVDIPPLVALTMGAHTAAPCRTAEELLVFDQWARQHTQGLIDRRQ